MMRKIVTTAAIGALAVATVNLTSSATADEGPPLHGHIMLIGAVWEGEGPGTVVKSFRRCITLASGNVLSLQAHHQTVHRGQAGEALRAAGNLVIPLAPLSGFTGCGDFE